LDGGRIARAIFSRTFGFIRTTRFLAAAGKWLGGIFVIFGFLLQALGYFRYEPALFIILGVFFWLGSSKELANARIVFLKQLCRKKEQLLKEGLMYSDCLTVNKDTPLHKIVDQFTTDRYSLVSVLSGKDRIEKVLSETQVVQGMVDYGMDCKVEKL
jgi:stage IV sporulation protein FB